MSRPTVPARLALARLAPARLALARLALARLALACLALALAPTRPPAAQGQRIRLGCQATAIELDEGSRELCEGVTVGVRLSALTPGYPAEKSGFREGDVVVSIGGETFGGDGGSLEEALARFARLADASRTGERWSVVLLRDGLHVTGTRDGEPLEGAEELLREAADGGGVSPGARVELELSRGLRAVELDLEIGAPPARTSRSMAKKLFDGQLFSRHKLAREIEALVDEHGLRDDTDDLRQRLDRLSRAGDASRLDAVNLALREPWRLPGLAEHLAEGFETEALGKSPSAWPPKLTRALALAADADADYRANVERKLRALDTGLSTEAHLDQLAELLAVAHGLRDQALARISAEDRAHAAAHWRDIGLQLEPGIYLYTDRDAARRDRNERTIRIGERVARGPMLAAAAKLGPLLSETWQEKLAHDLEADGRDLDAPVVARRDTPHGPIVIAGRGPDVHRSGGAALLVDLGGDDLYTNDQGATVEQAETPVRGVSILLDLAGSDAYEATHDGAQGMGLLGIGLLFDREGDDSYVGLRWAQGVGFMGVGLLIDAAGDDVYRSHAFAQGLGLWGAGCLLDLAGDDRYESHMLAQAVGMPGGVGVLVDREGGDAYYCKGTHPTGYGTAGVFEGWGQGCGVGFRLNASGGVALLVDEGGGDRYEGGNFSQGGGYYYGLGALLDRGKANDAYVGSRYNQGFAAHQACGYFHESGGDDTYATRNSVAHGLAWDECVTAFIEDAGDDVYQGGGFSLGASAHNAICVFWDRRGADTYLRAGLARAGGNDYHGGTSLTVFVDDGKGRDRYPGEDRNGTVQAGPEHAIFIDR